MAKKRIPKALSKTPNTPTTSSLREQVAKARLRRKRVREDILAGRTNVRLLADKYGVSKTTIRNDMEHVFGKWASADATMYKNDERRRQVRVAQLTNVLTKAVESFERSLDPKEKITIHKVSKKCEVCRGRGKVKDLECEACEGVGRIKVISETVETTGSSGDPTFLNVVRNCVNDIAKLEGLLTTRIQQSGTVTHDLLVHLVDELEDNSDKHITDNQIQDVAANFLEQQKLTIEGSVVPAKQNGKPTNSKE